MSEMLLNRWSFRRSLTRRIGDEAEPAELPTKTNADGGLVQTLKRRSLVRNYPGSTPKTPRNRGNLVDGSRPEQGFSAAAD
jgi:hypothetical protein